MNRSIWRTTAALLAVCALVAACEGQEEMDEEMTAASQPTRAVAVIYGQAGSTVSGSVTFTQQGDAVRIVADVAGAPVGVHGLHLHELGDATAADFTSTGGHFNPTGVAHGSPDDPVHHAGDFGNITIAADGTGHLELSTSMITVAEGSDSVLGRAVILHAGTDDLTSQPTGAAGGRIGCGIVGRAGG